MTGVINTFRRVLLLDELWIFDQGYLMPSMLSGMVSESVVLATSDVSPYDPPASASEVPREIVAACLKGDGAFDKWPRPQ